MPAASRGPLIDPRSAVYAWVRRVVEAVECRTGRPSAWNGEIYEEIDPRALGGAEADGSMTLGVEAVIEPIRRAYSGHELTDEDLEAARDAVATIVHEAAHLSTRNGDSSLPGAHPPLDIPGEALDEGLTELWTRDNVDDVIQDIGMDEQVPDLLDAPANDSYPAYTAATLSLVDSISQLAGEPSEQVREKIRATDLSQRWNAIADLVIDRHLDGLMPAADRLVIRQSLADGLRADFARAQDIQEKPKLDDATKIQEGFHVGQRAANNLDEEVGRLQDGYRSRQRMADRSSLRPATVDQTDPGVDHLRGMMGGSPPAAQAVRMEPGQATRVSYRVAAVGWVASRARS